MFRGPEAIKSPYSYIILEVKTVLSKNEIAKKNFLLFIRAKKQHISGQFEALRKKIVKRLYSKNYLPSIDEVMYSSVFSHDNRHGIDYFRTTKSFELWTQDYILALSNYLLNRVRHLLAATGKSKITILEVGAGNGKLSHYLKEQIRIIKSDSKIIIRATDDYSWIDKDIQVRLNVPSLLVKRAYPVEKLSVNEAIIKYNPEIIISSWMPQDVDWSAYFVSHNTVQEYILVGDEYGCCGKRESWDAKDGFIKRNLRNKHITPIQFGRVPDSTTISYIRTKKM